MSLMYSPSFISLLENCLARKVVLTSDICSWPFMPGLLAKSQSRVRKYWPTVTDLLKLAGRVVLSPGGYSPSR